jgi:ribokinase
VPFDLIVVGSANLDLVATAPRLPNPGETVLGTRFAQYPGGKGLNQAVAAARVGAAVAFVGAVGGDDAGRTLLEVAAHEGVDTSLVDIVAADTTGHAVITVDAHGENSIVVIAGANGRARVTSLPAATVVLAQLEVPIPAVITAFELARAAGYRTVLNPAPAPVGGLEPSLLSLCDVIIPNEHELELLGGVDHLLAGGVGVVVVTRGANGVDISEPSRTRSVAPFSVDVVDTTGAGDAFCGAFTARLASGHDLEDAARYGAAAGALATTVAGAIPSLPAAAAVEHLLATRTG